MKRYNLSPLLCVILCLACALTAFAQGASFNDKNVEYTFDLPEAIWNRPKMGFSFPFSQWLRKSTYVKDLMQGEDKTALDNYNQFLRGEFHWSQFMSLIIIKSREYAYRGNVSYA